MIVNIKLCSTVWGFAITFVWEWKLDAFLTQHFEPSFEQKPYLALEFVPLNLMRLLGPLCISFSQGRSVGDPIRTNPLIVKRCCFAVNAKKFNIHPTLMYPIRGSRTKEWSCKWFEVCTKMSGVKGRQFLPKGSWRTLGLDVIRIPPYPNRLG